MFTNLQAGFLIEYVSTKQIVQRKENTLKMSLGNNNKFQLNY